MINHALIRSFFYDRNYCENLNSHGQQTNLEKDLPAYNPYRPDLRELPLLEAVRRP